MTSVYKKILLGPFFIKNTAFGIHFAFLRTYTDRFITGVGKLRQLRTIKYLQNYLFN